MIEMIEMDIIDVEARKLRPRRRGCKLRHHPHAAPIEGEMSDLHDLIDLP